MNISPVSFGSTYKLVNNNDYAIIESTMKKFINNHKTLTGNEFSLDIARRSNGDFYLLTGMEADIFKKVKSEQLQSCEDGLTLSTDKKVSLYDEKKQAKIDCLVDTTYLGKNIKVQQGLFVIC